MTLTPRPREPEFADTEIDRAALAAILTAADQDATPGDDLADMNARWDRLAVGLAGAREGGFDDWSRRAMADVENQPKEARVRVSQLIGHLIGWRLGDV